MRDDPEDGYTGIPHQVIEGLCQSKITMRQIKILLFIFRKTYGWHKEFDWITREQISIGIDYKHLNNISSDMVILKKMNMIFVDGHKIGPNSDPDSWIKSLENKTPESRKLDFLNDGKSRKLDSKVLKTRLKSLENKTPESRKLDSYKNNNTITKISITKHTPPTPQGVSVESSDAMEVFEHWRITMPGRQSARATDGRIKKIKARLKSFTVQECKTAINGCLVSPWHNGSHPKSKTVYDKIELIFRSDSNTEDFIKRFGEHSEQYERQAQQDAEREAILNGCDSYKHYTGGETFDHGEF